MARWQDGYTIGQPVEYRSTGDTWARGVVVKKTATGMPHVQLDTGGTFAVSTKGDIRPRTRPPGGLPPGGTLEPPVLPEATAVDLAKQIMLALEGAGAPAVEVGIGDARDPSKASVRVRAWALDVIVRRNGVTAFVRVSAEDAPGMMALIGERLAGRR